MHADIYDEQKKTGSDTMLAGLSSLAPFPPDPVPGLTQNGCHRMGGLGWG